MGTNPSIKNANPSFTYPIDIKRVRKECPARSPILSGFFAAQKPLFGASNRQKKNPSLFHIRNKLGFFRDRRKENAARHAPHLYHPRGQGRACPRNAAKILGHADYSTTANIYTHIDAETLVDAVTNALLTNAESDKKEKP